jgi:hypothetical protein
MGWRDQARLDIETALQEWYRDHDNSPIVWSDLPQVAIFIADCITSPDNEKR